jgi:hypothetical protein
MSCAAVFLGGGDKLVLSAASTPAAVTDDLLLHVRLLRLDS